MAPTNVGKSQRTVSSKSTKNGRVEKSSDTSRRVTRATTKRFKDAYEQNAKSPLLRLPGELRNRIYEYAIGGRKVMPMYRWFGSGFEVTSDSSGTFTSGAWEALNNLPRVCRQLRGETMVLPFRLNTFDFPSIDIFQAVLSDLEDIYRNAITTVELDTWNLPGEHGWRDEIKTLESCTGLEKLTISIPWPEKVYLMQSLSRNLLAREA